MDRVIMENSQGMLVSVPMDKLDTMKEGRPEEEWTPEMEKAVDLMLSRILSEKE